MKISKPLEANFTAGRGLCVCMSVHVRTHMPTCICLCLCVQICVLPMTRIWKLSWDPQGDPWQTLFSSKVHHLSRLMCKRPLRHRPLMCDYTDQQPWMNMSGNVRSQACSVWLLQPHWAGYGVVVRRGSPGLSCRDLFPTPTLLQAVSL